MTLISMLIALILERLAVRSAPWQFVSYFRHYLHACRQGLFAKLLGKPFGALAVWLLPVVLLSLLLWLVNFWLFDLVVSTLVLLICIGSWHYRLHYKQYRNACERGDEEAVALALQQAAIDQGGELDNLSYGHRWIWINFKYYAAVLFWYALLGAPGALAYALLRQFAEPFSYRKTSEPDQSSQQAKPAEVTGSEPSVDAVISTDAAEAKPLPSIDETAYQPAETSQQAEALQPPPCLVQQQCQLMAQDISHWADWLPARFFGFGLALVGHFSKATQALLQYGSEVNTPAPQLLAHVANAAEPLPNELQNTLEESSSFVALAKRNILFFLAFVALLTLSGLLA